MIGVLIYDKLSNFAGLTAIVGDRIYPIIAPEDIDVPHVVYSVRIREPDYVKSTAFSSTGVVDNVEVTLEVASLSYVELNTIMGEIRLALEGSALTYEDVTTRPITLDSQTEGWSNKARTYVGFMDFSLITNRVYNG